MFAIQAPDKCNSLQLENQISRLAETGCELFFEEKTSGAAKKRPQLEKLLGQLRKDGSIGINGSKVT